MSNEVPIETTNPETNADYAQMAAVFDRVMAEEPSSGPLRDESGRFKSSEPAEAEPVVAGGEVEAHEASDDGAGEEPAVEAPPPEVATPAPAHLPQELKADWEKIPEGARKAITDLQAEHDRKMGELGGQLRDAKPINDAYNRLRQQYPDDFGALDNSTLSEAVANLAVVQARLGRDPVGTIVQVAQQYGVLGDLARIVAGQQPTGEGQQVAQLQQTIAQLQKKIEDFGNPEAIDQRISQRMEVQATETMLAELRKEAPLYAEVEAALPTFIEMAWGQLGHGADRKAVFKLAYDMAVHANPVTRAKAVAPGKTAAAPSPERVEQIRAATSVNVKSTANGKERAMTEREHAEAVYDRMHAGG
jgi:hypothetical protein